MIEIGSLSDHPHAVEALASWRHSERERIIPAWMADGTIMHFDLTAAGCTIEVPGGMAPPLPGGIQ